MICEIQSSSYGVEGTQGSLGECWRLREGADSLCGPTSAYNTVTLPAGRMAPAAAWLLLLQLILEPALVMNIGVQMAMRNFRDLNIDYPKVSYPDDFQGYCNGLMAYVRGKKKNWYCPEIHYVIHASWGAIRKFCKHCENFCDNYDQYCTVTRDALPLTICSRATKQPPPGCHYNDTVTNQRLYLLCSQKDEGEPIDIIGTY